MNNYDQLISSIEGVHHHLQVSAANAVNQALTIRNWLIGYYIVEFEQNGKDRAEYGKGLLAKIADSISLKGLTAPELSRCRQFYNAYPQIFGSLTQNLSNQLPKEILGVLTQKSKSKTKPLLATPTRNALASESGTQPQVPPEKLLARLSFTHLVELIKINNPLKRTFYEIECIKGIWSVRELKRQIASQYFERSGLSQKPEKLAKLVQEKTSPQAPKDIIKNIYTLEFLDLNKPEIVEESDLETALLDHLQQFIIELGHGFCFESRQKRILIGENYYFIDLLFYYRILKCHVLLELKIGAFEHGDIGQLNTYLNYYKAEICEKTDNPPVGILLVAEKDQALVKYATAGMDKNLFVQQYLLQLPSTEQLRQYIEKELKELN
ncbi:MAG: PDDEXK nuclease domain-containing protein [Bacteroidota bacterium]|nr:PDDEXK nuclease domain-containing protein [Bacteroidota bacterium]